MALNSVEVGLMGMYDRQAYQKGLAEQAGDGGTDLWVRVDATNDEPFENRVKGQNVTNLDLAYLDQPVQDWSEMSVHLNDLRNYFVTDLSLSGFDAYATLKRWRVPLKMARIIRGRFGDAELSAVNVHADADALAAAPGQTLGQIVSDGIGGEAFTAGTDIDLTVSGPSPIRLRVVTKGAAAWGIDVTCLREDASTEVINQVIGGADPVDTVYMLGAGIITADGGAAQKDVTIGAGVAQFADDQQVLLLDWTGSAAPNEVWIASEIATIDTIGGTTLTLVDNLLHTYNAAATSIVIPLWEGVTAMATGAGGNGNNLDDVLALPAPDRRFAL